MNTVNERQAVLVATVRKLRSAAQALNADACIHQPSLREALQAEADAIFKRADDIEQQVRRERVDEPEWGSVVRAFVCGSNPEGWIRTLAGEYSGWTNSVGKTVPWRRLCEPEVLRVGIES